MTQHSNNRITCDNDVDADGDSSELVADSEVKETPLPWSMLMTLMAVRLSEPINFTLILPFVYKMVEGFDVAETPKDIAFYAGMLTASFFMCQTATVMYWGQLSDRIGRRPVLLMGLVGNLVTFTLFGVSKSFKWALVARSLNGLLNGNMVVVKSVLAEITDDTNRSRAMALLPFMWNVGSVAGAAIGGLFSDPAAQYPNVFGHIWVFQEFPYLLPCLIGSSVTLLGLIFGVYTLEETLASKIARGQAARDPRPSPSPPVESPEWPAKVSNGTAAVSETSPLIQQQEGSAYAKPVYKRTARDLLTPTVVVVMVTNAILCLSIAICDQIYPIFAATETSDGGLGFDTRSIGISLAISGVVVVYLQLVAYPRLERKYGALHCYQQGQKILIPFYLAIPFLSLLASHLDQETLQHLLGVKSATGLWSSETWPEYILLWALLILLLLVRVTGNVLAFTSVNLLTANLAPTTADLGFMNGAQQLAMSSARVIGPLAAGYVWSWSIKNEYSYPFNAHLVWVICAALTGISQYMSFSIPSSVNKFTAVAVDEYGRPIHEDAE